MNRFTLSVAGAGLTVLMLAAGPALAGNGQGNQSGANCPPGRPNCTQSCKPGRPGCQLPAGYYAYHPHHPYNDNYAENHGGQFNAYPVRPSNRMSCGSAQDVLEDNGYRNISVKDCYGRRYNFTANKNGRTFWISFNAITGSFKRGRN